MRFPLTSRARAERATARLERSLARADELVEERDKAIALVRKLLQEMNEAHRPYPGDWSRLGNYGGVGRSEWWCTECRTHWPCKPWRQIRRLYSATYSTRMPKPVPEMEITMQPKRDPNIADPA